MNKVIYPGSFDPLTKGHEEIIARISKLYDEVIVLVAINSSKEYIFDIDERVNLIKKVISKYKNIKVEKWEGLIADYCKQNNIHIIVKGIRNADDLESELNQYYYNKSLNNELETICLLSSHENILISSSAIKELAHFHQSYDSYLPSEIVDDVKKKLG